MTSGDLTEVANQTSDAVAWKGLKYDCLESYGTNGLLWLDLYVLFDFSMVFQWRGHDLISDLRSLSKNILDMHFVILLFVIDMHFKLCMWPHTTCTV